ncbi:hypothetical protein [Streptomyces albus]|uniref:hypothetical protein n=1 Tax=Streptomyces albus TaxID=1888 RepID=UPI00131AB568|nr:hypothetical protein [Streptomyces albus]
MSGLADLRAERRADRAAEAEQRRQDEAAEVERRAEQRRLADEREARLRAQQRAEKDEARRARERRRVERAQRRSQVLAPQNVYRTGTLALVVASGLASLPAQVLHFVGISVMLLPLPFALEGAAWVMAAGVAHADARGLPGWVRWLLRGFVVAAATFAAFINYGYGRHLPDLSDSDRTAAGAGLAAVTLLGPLLFEVRQWVCTLTVADGDPQARHSRLRRRHHRPVARLADRLVSAAPFGSLPAEEAWRRAWLILTGTDEVGMTPDLHRRAVASAVELDKAKQAPADKPSKRSKSADNSAERSMGELDEQADCPPPPVEPAQPTDTPAPAPRPTPTEQSPVQVKPAPAPVAAASTDRPRRATGRLPQSARTKRQTRTPDQLLSEARSATRTWADSDLTAEAIRTTVRTSAAKARELRETLRAERAEGRAAEQRHQMEAPEVEAAFAVLAPGHAADRGALEVAA